MSGSDVRGLGPRAEGLVAACARERYAVMLDGCILLAVGFSLREALEAALEVVDGPSPGVLRQVDIIEQGTREKRARWCRSGLGWSVSSVPGWLT